MPLTEPEVIKHGQKLTLKELASHLHNPPYSLEKTLYNLTANGQVDAYWYKNQVYYIKVKQ